MNKLKHFLPKYTLKIMYSSLIAPHFNNNILLWGFNTTRITFIGFLNILKINDIFSSVSPNMPSQGTTLCKLSITLEFLLFSVTAVARQTFNVI